MKTFSSDSGCLRQVWERVEIGFLWSCRRFDQDFLATPPPTLQEHVVQVIRRMSNFMWNSYGNRNDFPFDYSSGSVTLRGIERPTKGTDRVWETNVLVDSYINKVVHALFSARDSSFDTQEEVLELLHKCILNSRSGNELTPEYLEWVSSGVDPAEIERCCLRASALEKSRKSSNLNIRHEIIEIWGDIGQPVLRYVATFKGTVATSVREISDEELYRMGWFCNDANRRSPARDNSSEIGDSPDDQELEPENALEYWRFKRCGDLILKVNMNEAIQGLYAGNGKFIAGNGEIIELETVTS
ncbi:hypothetical protein N656DRAFT_88109 [Canariomyces notabilis]|uniref:Uncharacterized protein n=1 Tax=Canariomyces notabilis TaxID=2074819 RepID=A0AAN6YRU0_9PEZI|nr:hypothetical protein N656DRAFT_88109 [Canariomyces arenarius]